MRDDHFRSMITGLEGLGLSRNQIAQNCGISRVTLWRLASGSKQDPSWRTARSLQSFYETTIFEHVSPVKQKSV